MKHWYTFGAFGDTVVELSAWDMFQLLVGKTLRVKNSCIAISFGPSRLKSIREAPSREDQLK
jgi:hypothetical protein